LVAGQHFADAPNNIPLRIADDEEFKSVALAIAVADYAPDR
jgi:hypothetical protein